MNKDIFICPVCKGQISKLNKSYFCASGHCYDEAKSGYLNLLLASQKHTLMPGDNQAMSLCRHSFLSAGHFEKLMTAIASKLELYAKKDSVILDAGCGTGDYLAFLQDEFENLVGVDISKDAINIASKTTSKNISYVVSSTFNLPVKNNSVDAILNIFAPKPVDEFDRVLKNEGILIEVVPGVNHLKEIKDILYVRQDNTLQDNKLKQFNLIREEEIVTKETIDNLSLKNLFTMTPYYYKTQPQSVEKLFAINFLDITYDFLVRVYKK